MTLMTLRESDTYTLESYMVQVRGEVHLRFRVKRNKRMNLKKYHGRNQCRVSESDAMFLQTTSEFDSSICLELLG